jgi:hypothetical protein
LSPREAQQVAREHGVRYPIRAWDACVQVEREHATVPYFVLCAFLMQETGGGMNIYGHDVDAEGVPRPFYDHGVVTQSNYADYLIERDLCVRVPKKWAHLGRRSQGVGPLQLTWWKYQDEADQAGGCWNVSVNLLVGARILGRLRDGGRHTWHVVAREWSGKDTYANEMDARFAQWRKWLPPEHVRLLPVAGS